MSEPKFYTRSYVDSECTVTPSSGSDSKQKLFDRDNDSQWISSGENSDADEASVEIEFKQAGATISRTIDTIILVNHNLEDPIAEYWDGSAWQTFDSETDLTSGVATMLTRAAVSTERIRIRCSQTITADAEKRIGELLACEEELDLSDTVAQDLSAYEVTHAQRMAVELPLIDGSLHRSVVRHSPNRSDKYEARATLQFLTETQLEALRSLKASGQPFLWQPESTQRPDEVYLVNWAGNFQYRYATGYKGAGFNLTLDLREA
jgi:hypothetical protein